MHITTTKCIVHFSSRSVRTSLRYVYPVVMISLVVCTHSTCWVRFWSKCFFLLLSRCAKVRKTPLRAGKTLQGAVDVGCSKALFPFGGRCCNYVGVEQSYEATVHFLDVHQANTLLLYISEMKTIFNCNYHEGWSLDCSSLLQACWGELIFSGINGSCSLLCQLSRRRNIETLYLPKPGIVVHRDHRCVMSNHFHACTFALVEHLVPLYPWSFRFFQHNVLGVASALRPTKPLQLNN